MCNYTDQPTLLHALTMLPGIVYSASYVYTKDSKLQSIHKLFSIHKLYLFFNGHGSSVDSMTTSYASSPEINPCVHHNLSWKFFLLLLIQEDQVVRKNGHLILVNCLWEAYPETVWLSKRPSQHELSCYRGHNATNQIKQTSYFSACFRAVSSAPNLAFRCLRV